MIRWLAAPKLMALAKYVECYWYLDKPSDANGFDRPKLNPDPSGHLILFAENQTYQYEIAGKIFNGKGSHWLYPYSKTIELDHAKSLACLGIKFKVGALYSLNNGCFSPELLNTVKTLNFAALKGTSLQSEQELLVKAKYAADKCIEMLDELFLPLLAHCYEDKHSELTRRILPLLTDKPIGELNEPLFCSQRTLERSFSKVTGFTLKQCQSMNKLEAILEHLHQREQCDIDWVDIAYQFGFSDQPHLIRYLKQQINVTPKNYAQQRGFTIDVYGGVASK
jgi:AraC-like DNA-binding protein